MPREDDLNRLRLPDSGRYITDKSIIFTYDSFIAVQFFNSDLNTQCGNCDFFFSLSQLSLEFSSTL